MLCLFSSHQINAQTLADTLEAKVIGAVREGRVVDQLSNQFNEFPKGEFLLASENKNLNYGIIIYNIDILPSYAVFSAAIAFRDPRTNQLIAFKADQVKFSNTHGLTGSVKLYLISDVHLEFGAVANLAFYAGAQNTYATFDCQGLKEFSIAGEVLFNSSFILPVNAKGEIETDKKLSTQFALIAQSWSEILVQITLQPFQIKGLKNFVFTITDATLDLSEAHNASDMVLPTVYHEENTTINLWEGFFLKKGSVQLPPHFNSKSEQRTTIGVENLIIDEWGISGQLFGKNILNFENGQLGEWPFSITQIEVNILHNEIIKGQMTGEIGLPILPDTSRLSYKGYIGINDNYGFQISVRNNLSIPALKIATLQLTSNSFINCSIENGEVKLNCNFNGTLNIAHQANATQSAPNFHFPDIVFQGLRVANTEPHFDIAYLGLQNKAFSAQQIGNYPLQIERIGLFNNGSEKVLQIKCAMNLMDKISVKTGVNISAVYKNNKLLLNGLMLDAIEINSSISCFSLNGKLQFIRHDPTYGNGLNGSIQFKMKQPVIEASATVLFGTINQHRYWYVDANAIWDQPGLPFLPGIEINGFLGGAWQGVRERNGNDPIPQNDLGLSASGKSYVPDAKAGLGLRAGLYIRSTGGNNESKPFIAKTAIEIQFNRNLGINQIDIFGNAEFMAKKTTLNASDLKQNTNTLPSQSNWKNYLNNFQPTGNISSPFLLNFDFAQQIYQAHFAVYIQGLANDKIVGGGPKGFAGEVAAYFSRSKWYLHIGTPQQALGVKMKLNTLGYAQVNAYFMAGKDLPPALPLPTEITSIIGPKNADAMRQLEALNIGNAFAFGARMALEIGSEGGEKNVSIYAHLKALIGLDINIRATNNSAHCTFNNETPGINGWFANGQPFAYLQGKVGAAVQTKSIQSRFDLMTITTATQLYCEGPKPFYSNGSTNIKVNIAGVINKQLKLNFEIGEPCEMRQSKLSDTSIILTTYPDNNVQQFNVANNLQSIYSAPINKPLQDAEGRTFMFQLKQYEVSYNKQLIVGQLRFNNEHTAITFTPESMLPANQTMQLKIVIEAQGMVSNYELLTNNHLKILPAKNELDQFNACIAMMKNNGLKEMAFGNGRKLIRTDQMRAYLLNGLTITETRIINFTTGNAPQNITEVNIAYCYPQKHQINYHSNLSTQGFIQLYKNQQNLNVQSNEKLMVVFADPLNKIIAEVPATYAKNCISYQLPNSIFKTNSTYELILKIKAINGPSEIGNSLVNTTNNVSISTVNKANNNRIDKHLYNYRFGCSYYISFNDKMKNMIPFETQLDNQLLRTNFKNKLPEYFDAVEMATQQNAMVQPKLLLQQNTWLTSESKKLYSIFESKDPFLQACLYLGRDTSLLGLIPLKAIKINELNISQMTIIGNGLNGYQRAKYSQELIQIEDYSYQIMLNDLEAIQTSLIQYVNSPNVNSKFLSSYLNQMSYTPALKQMANGLQMNAEPLWAGATTMALASTNQSLSYNTTITSGTSQQKNQWLLKIAQMQLAMRKAQMQAFQINYYLPGHQVRNTSYLINQSATK